MICALTGMGYKHIGKQIRETRKSKRISQKEMAAKLKIDIRSYRRIEAGERKTCDLNQIMRIARILEISHFRVFGDINIQL
ncbi:helix-turn-helix domain-containing protein [Taibaiella soli]|uniref:HTH cro/C1-type domain-containing protein n=1 Tax=Taibaiella soli TaxID=1649169 RepID=A0A2W2AYP7_9BACT|nr:hypothetical protein DN068_09690 [Taibaiella soli]